MMLTSLIIKYKDGSTLVRTKPQEITIHKNPNMISTTHSIPVTKQNSHLKMCLTTRT